MTFLIACQHWNPAQKLSLPVFVLPETASLSGHQHRFNTQSNKAFQTRQGNGGGGRGRGHCIPHTLLTYIMELVLLLLGPEQGHIRAVSLQSQLLPGLWDAHPGVFAIINSNLWPLQLLELCGLKKKPIRNSATPLLSHQFSHCAPCWVLILVSSQFFVFLFDPLIWLWHGS